MYSFSSSFFREFRFYFITFIDDGHKRRPKVWMRISCNYRMPTYLESITLKLGIVIKGVKSQKILKVKLNRFKEVRCTVSYKNVSKLFAATYFHESMRAHSLLYLLSSRLVSLFYRVA